MRLFTHALPSSSYISWVICIKRINSISHWSTKWSQKYALQTGWRWIDKAWSVPWKNAPIYRLQKHILLQVMTFHLSNFHVWSSSPIKIPNVTQKVRKIWKIWPHHFCAPGLKRLTFTGGRVCMETRRWLVIWTRDGWPCFDSDHFPWKLWWSMTNRLHTSLGWFYD